jgi:deoxyribodipyrimidine photo-lyase
MQKNIADNVECPVYVVDTHNIVPTWEVSDKHEFAARTIRPKIQKLIDKYIDEPQHLVKQELKWPGKVKKIVEMEELIDKLFSHIPSNSQDLSFVSGEKAAQEALKRFITHGLRGYEVERNDPSLEHLSELSPYLHFGQLSRLRAFIDVEHAAQHDHTLRKDADAFIEELNVRSALSDNYCYFNNQYDSLEGAADWAEKLQPDTFRLWMPARGTRAAYVMVDCQQFFMFRLWMPARGTKAASVIVSWLHQLMSRLWMPARGTKAASETDRK